MAIPRATQSANELCKYYWGAQSLSVSAGRLRHNGHRLQVRNSLERPVQQQNKLTALRWTLLRLTTEKKQFSPVNCKIFLGKVIHDWSLETK